MKSFLLDYNETNTFSRKDLGHTRVLHSVVEKTHLLTIFENILWIEISLET